MNSTTGRRRLVLEALEQWNINPDAVRLRHHGENTVYEIRCGSDRLIARLSGTDLQSAISVRGELRFIDRCANYGLHVARAIPTTKGKPFALVPEVDPESGKKRDRIITLFPFIAGRRIGQKGMTEQLVFHWGNTIAQLQNATDGLRQTKQARRPRWDEIGFQRELLSNTLAEKSWFREEWEMGMQWMHQLPTSEQGLLHADVHEGNFKVDRGELYLFDFDDSMVCWCAYDLAVVLLRFGPATDRAWLAQFRQNLLAGYRSARPLSPEWEARIDGFIRVRRLWIANWLTMREDIPRLQRYQEDYMRRLRFLVMREPTPYS
jgi:Ser/Thr protein kinase RdoA (MazF antagonist)